MVWCEFEEYFKSSVAFLFDLDGTIADTMSMHYEAYRRVFERMGGALEYGDFMRIVGPPALVVIPQFALACGLDCSDKNIINNIHAEKKSEFKRVLSNESLVELPAADLLRSFSKEKAIAVVTSGNREGAKAILRALDIEESVDVLISSDDVRNGKPDGEPYLMALKMLSAPSASSIAFEDNEAGIASALSAGLRVINVKNFTLVSPDVFL